jgi:hypothetical protein
MEQAINNTVKLHSPSSYEEYIQFTLEKGDLQFRCNVTIELQLENEKISEERKGVHVNEIIKIANWYKAMSGGSEDGQADLSIPELSLKMANYYFEKGDGVYYLCYTSKFGQVFKFQFWEQVGNSNMTIYNKLMQCL